MTQSVEVWTPLVEQGTWMFLSWVERGTWIEVSLPELWMTSALGSLYLSRVCVELRKDGGHDNTTVGVAVGGAEGGWGT